MKEKLLDKMIAGMECCQEINGCSKCPYIYDKHLRCIEQLDEDILYYLKQQRDFEKKVLSWMSECDEKKKADKDDLSKKGEI